jgi:hypothetical protein
VHHIRIDGERKVGRAADRAAVIPSVSQLCGHCFDHRVAISPDGDVYGCILSRFLPTGNVRDLDLLTGVSNEEQEHSTSSGAITS